MPPGFTISTAAYKVYIKGQVQRWRRKVELEITD
jgi:hypothetical protein